MTDKLELKSSHEVIDTVNVADVESIFYCKPTDPDILTVLMKDGKRLYCDEVCPVQEEPVSEDLEEAAKQYAKDYLFTAAPTRSLTDHFKAGANWQFKKVEEALLSEVLPCFMHGGEADEVVAKLEEVLNV